ncbi:MAG: hypothetical protein HC867_09285 [Bacteroidia bacterium]|nr:hypothetical protein [Bacteroidia bacterium]
MMRFLTLLLILPSIISYSQSGSSSGLQQTAKTFMLQGDFDNAIVVLNRALQQDKNNLELEKRPGAMLLL